MTLVRKFHLRPGQRGAALLLAMIILTLVATLTVSMVWQQWRSIQIETAERSRAQSSWILSGALDWANLILKEDARTGGPDHLGEPWAVPLAEARLSTFLAADKENNSDEGAPEAFLSGSISDAQARFNVFNLLDANGLVSKEDLAILRRLCENVDVIPALADTIGNGLRDAYGQAAASGSSAPAPTNPPLMPRRIDQLTWLGVDAASLHRLEPYIVLLPERTTININTASREVIAAAIPGMNVGDAARLIQLRARTPFRKQSDIQAQMPVMPDGALKGVDVMSSFFEVRGRLRLSDRVLEQRSLVKRSRMQVTVLSRERVSSQDTGS